MNTPLQTMKNGPTKKGIFLKKTPWLILYLSRMFYGFSYSQDLVSISGKVTSGDDGNAVPGVTVMVKGRQTGTVSDLEGNFSIQAPTDGVLMFSFIGYQTVEENINSRTIINVQLVSDTQSLEEFVVTGYSTQQRKNITGSVSVVDVDNLRKIPARSAEQALQGMASGVNITKSGVPGASSKIFIRGMTSFGNTDPLVIVDG